MRAKKGVHGGKGKEKGTDDGKNEWSSERGEKKKGLF